jgi:hypothetical protein
MRFLMPFYGGARREVIPTHFPSNLFHGYIAEAYRALRQVPASHFTFIADDLFLNPALTGSNLAGCLGLQEEAGYIKSLTPLSDVSFRWPHLFRAVRTLERQDPKIQWRREVPPRDVAVDRVRRHVPTGNALSWANLRAPTAGLYYVPRRMAAGWFDILRHRGRHQLPYPAVMGYSDLVVVPASGLAEFARLCGVFAAAGLFVEVAIPTALALSCSSIVRESETRWRGIELWDKADVRDLEERFDRDLAQLTHWLPNDALYLHPVKLSRWRIAHGS